MSINDEKIFCVPGDRLCISDDNNLAGVGTYVYRNYIYSAISGIINVKFDDEEENNLDRSIKDQVKNKHRTLSVIHNSRIGLNRVPTVGVIVTCRVLSINSIQAKCQILCIEDNILKLPFKSCLRKEDIAADNKDIIEVYKCFRPRDIILARVIGLSDQGYMLTTAEEELGVVFAFSESRKIMIPISWNQMVCPDTYIKEDRKIAKVLTPPNSSESNDNTQKLNSQNSQSVSSKN